MLTAHVDQGSTRIISIDSFCFVLQDGEPIIYNGTLEQVRVISRILGLRIDPCTALDYFSIAAFPVRDAHTRVRFVSSLDDLELFEVERSMRSALGEALLVPKVEGYDDVGVVISGTTLFDSTVYPATVRVGYDGDIEFALRRPITMIGTIGREVFLGGRRSIEKIRTA